MNSAKEKIKEYFMLFRIRGCIYTALFPVTGALAMGKTEIRHLALLIIIGCIAHIRGFVTNDYFDSERDKKTPFYMSRPLAKGTISKRTALLIIFLSWFIFWTLVGLFFLNLGTGLMAVLAPLSSFIYNFAGKKFIGSDLFLAFSVFCSCLLGAFSVNLHLTSTALAVSLIWTFEFLYLNMIAGMKDLESDRKSGARTLALYLGVMTKGNIMKTTWSFRFIASVLRLCQIGIIACLLLSPQMKESYFQSLLLLSLILFEVGAVVIATFMLLFSRGIDLKRWTAWVVVQFSTNIIIILLLLVPISGVLIPVGIYLLLWVWATFFNLVTYGNATVFIAPIKKNDSLQ